MNLISLRAFCSQWAGAPATTRTMLLVSVAIVEHQGHVLVARRSPGTPYAGYAEFPGGKLERGETPSEAAVRECREETGLRVEVCSLMDAVVQWDEVPPDEVPPAPTSVAGAAPTPTSAPSTSSPAPSTPLHRGRPASGPMASGPVASERPALECVAPKIDLVIFFFRCRLLAPLGNIGGWPAPGPAEPVDSVVDSRWQARWQCMRTLQVESFPPANAGVVQRLVDEGNRRAATIEAQTRSQMVDAPSSKRP